MTERSRSEHRPEHRPHRRSGFATFVAVAYIALIGFAIAALSAMFVGQARHWKHEASQAQLRQYLLAANTLAAHTLGSQDAWAPGQPLDIPLPAIPETQGIKASARVHEVADSSDAVTIIVSIEHNKRVVGQAAQYVRDQGRWTLVGASFTGS